jgi:hypothetical protein
VPAGRDHAEVSTVIDVEEHRRPALESAAFAADFARVVACACVPAADAARAASAAATSTACLA